MTRLRRVLLGALPKVLLSRTTGLVTRVPVPRALRGTSYGWFARRYGCDLGEADGEPADYRSLAAFFQRPLVAGARPVTPDAPVVWPCDGRVVTTGPIVDGRIPQVKGVSDYCVRELVGDDTLGERFARAGASQATVYLAPGDYHRVHSPFAGTLTGVRRIPGTLFPVNPQAVGCIDRLFVRNARTVFKYEMTGGHRAVVVMVGALNVGDVHVSATPPCTVAAGDEIGRFGFGSTTVALLEPNPLATIGECAPETVVRMGTAVPLG